MWSRPATGLSPRQASRPVSRQPGQAKPWSAQSRPSTARPQTSVSARHEGSFVIALLEGRGAGREVGLAALDKDTGRVALAQVCSTDVNAFTKNLNCFTALRLSNLCQDTTSNTSTQAQPDSCSRYISLSIRRCLRYNWQHW